MNGDIELLWDNALGLGDFQIANSDLKTDAGLRTAVTISLFTDARKPTGDALLNPQDDPGGWWGDMLPDVEGDATGSLLWTLAREKSSDEVVILAEDFAARALAWMVTDRVASKIDVTASLLGDGILLLAIGIDRPARNRVNFTYNLNWAAEAARISA